MNNHEQTHSLIHFYQNRLQQLQRQIAATLCIQATLCSPNHDLLPIWALLIWRSPTRLGLWSAADLLGDTSL
ncbi:MAG: hypothetical protein OHK0022_17790 [Roseiflexaceae bacterium]